MRLFLENSADARRNGSCLTAATTNARQIVFISPPDVKNSQAPIRYRNNHRVGDKGQYFDPWGNNYVVRIDGDYNNQVANPYTADAGADPPSIGRNCMVAGFGWVVGHDCNQWLMTLAFLLTT